jgi:hypothetical protein
MVLYPRESKNMEKYPSLKLLELLIYWELDGWVREN